MRSAILLLATGALAFSQVGGHLPPGRSTGGAGFGRTIYPGTGAPAAIRGPGGRGPLYIPPAPAHPLHGRSIIVPYPVYYGGGYYPYDAPQALAAQDVPADYGQGGYPQQSPVVIINQSYQPDVVNPVLRDYSNTPLPEAVPQQNPQFEPSVANSDEPTIYLIAMKDRTIYATIAYWVDGETLNYITREGSPNRVSLDLVDRDFSKQLNEERHVEFKLPAVK
jgi:hypothetical protein